MFLVMFVCTYCYAVGTWYSDWPIALLRQYPGFHRLGEWRQWAVSL